MRHRTKSNKTIDIRLNEEKFYFPGETIKGLVIVHPKSPTKTNHIRLKFTGEVSLAIKDKETITLFQQTETLPVSDSTTAKTHVLEAKQHSFPFHFVVPDDLPSSMEFGKLKARIRYSLVAIHDRPMVPESLCAKAEYTVPILEFVDITSSRLSKPQEQLIYFLADSSKKQSKQCQLKVSMPRFGFTRGDIVPLNIVLQHQEAFTRKNAIKVELVRAVDIRTNRNTVAKEDVLKTMEHDINIIGPYNFSQALKSQLLIPTSTPPTISYKDKIIHIYYKIRIRAFLNKKKSLSESQVLEMPIVIGTWPRADIPIDDDDESELLETMGDLMLSDDEDDGYGSEPRYDNDASSHSRHTSLSTTHQPHHQRNLSSSMLSVGSVSTTTLTLRNITPGTNGVVRSDSNASRSSHKSHGSATSWRSSHSWEHSPTLSRTTLAGTNPSAPDAYSYPNHGLVTAGNQAYLIRSASAIDLLANPPLSENASQPYQAYPRADVPPQMQAYRTSYYENATSMSQPRTPNTHNFNVPLSPQPLVHPHYSKAGNHARVTSLDYQSIPLPQSALNDVPTHVLQPIPSTSTSSSTSRYYRGPLSTSTTSTNITTPASPSSRMPSRSYSDDITDGEPDKKQAAAVELSDSDDDDSSDDGDLLRIIEKKKKQAERERRQKQRTMLSAAE